MMHDAIIIGSICAMSVVIAATLGYECGLASMTERALRAEQGLRYVITGERSETP